ncbi:neurotrypsin-like isoform X1 [Halichondria panicea]|uniref:neurotrypsin-like isoform X1 n=1 Tax=Halichondria panicea TaxID=6063 RepID=UPI00312B86FA
MNTLPLLIVILVASSETVQGCIDGKVQRLDDGRVNICSDQEWKTVCEKNPDGRWNVRKTNVACRLLGYADNGATVNRMCSNKTAQTNYIKVQKCNGTENFLEECGIASTDFEDCRSNNCNNGQQRIPLITCLPVNCTNGTIRLVDGSTDREGRVEVCVGGRWGTVQTNNLQMVEFVCSTLGFPTEGSKAVTTFGHGTAPIRSCVIINSIIHCVDITDDDSMDLGVVCKTHQDVISSVINRTINQTLQTCPEQTTTSGTNQPATTSSEVDHFITLANNEMVGSCPTVVLGGVIGLLVVALLGLAIGLTITCCVLWKLRSQKQQAEYSQVQELSTIQPQLNNPVDNVSMEPNNAYSSSEPIYEQVANGNEQDHTVVS